MIRDLFSRLSRLPLHLPRTRPRRLIIFLRRFNQRAFNTAGVVFLSIIGLMAICADFLASDVPLAFSAREQLFILPKFFHPKSFDEMDIASVRAIIGESGGWALLPPIPYGPNQTKIDGQVTSLSPPNKKHLLGTDDKGRDVLARTIHGARSALIVGLGSVSLYLLVAVLLGAFAGYFGGLADRIALRLIETLTSFPTFFLILAIQGLLGTTSIYELVLIIGLTRWTDVARLTRAEVLRVVQEDYVAAARSLGLRHGRILLKHVLPSAMGPAAVAATFGVAGAILIESTLSFLGFGVPTTTASWGALLTDAFLNPGCYWLAVYPGLILTGTILSINLVGEGLREALDYTG